MNILLSILVFFFSTANAAVEKVIEPEKYILCKNKAVVRTIRVEASEDGCKAKYTKSGVDKTIGYGTHTESCNRFVDNVKANLESAAWKCRNLSDSKITAQAPDEEE